FRSKSATHSGIDSEHREVVLRDQGRANQLGTAGHLLEKTNARNAGDSPAYSSAVTRFRRVIQRQASPRRCNQAREDVVEVAVVNVVRVAERSTAGVVRERRYVDVDQAVRLCRLDGAQGDSVVGCEDGGVYGDPDGQCQYRYGAEPGVLQQLAEGVFQVIHGSWSVVTAHSARSARAGSIRDARTAGS